MNRYHMIRWRRWVVPNVRLEDDVNFAEILLVPGKGTRRGFVVRCYWRGETFFRRYRINLHGSGYLPGYRPSVSYGPISGKEFYEVKRQIDDLRKNGKNPGFNSRATA